MELNDFLFKSKKNNVLPLLPDHKRAVEACLAVQIHSTGARPKYESKIGVIYPETYHKKFDDLFLTRLLNRHPNENPSFYNWRLSVFSPVAKELYDKFISLCKGAILQPNNYTISADDRTNEYLLRYDLYSTLSDMVEFITQNPIGYIGVIIRGERQQNEDNRPEIVMVSAENILMEDYESIAFKYEGKTYFIDDNFQYEIDKSGVIEYPHNLGKKTVWRYTNSFLQPFQNWADLLVRNMNDDEAMVKTYSYPKVQIVEQECKTCMGVGQVAVYDEHDPNATGRTSCGTCLGKGTVSHNPGDFLTISEETIAKNNGTMYDMARFITPDIGIPEYHLKRWQVFYERCEKSLFLSPNVDVSQSGEAKKEDRKDQTIFLQTISSFLFTQIKKSVEYMTSFINVGQGIQEVYIIEPKQFDLMSDSDIINEFASLQAKTDDSQTLSELNYVVNNKIFRDDAVQKKITEVLYYADPLYGVSGNALRSKLLSGVYTDFDKTIHEKGYKLLVNMAKRDDQMFAETETNTLIDQLTELVNAQIPRGVYNG
jgi:hypothetical protein